MATTCAARVGALACVLGIAALAGPAIAADGAGFESLCERALTPDADGWFAAELDAVDALLGAGRLDEAAQRHRLAVQRLPRTADVSVEGKCVGRALYTRWYEQGRALDGARAGADPADWMAGLEAALARAGTADAPDAEALASRVPGEPPAYARAIGRLRAPQQRVEEERARGVFVIDLEVATARLGAGGADALAARAAARVRTALAAEDAAFEGEGPVPDAELAARMRSTEAMAGALAGLAPEAGRAETQGRLIRGGIAEDRLRDAAAWAAVAGEASVRAVRRRAEARADFFRDGGEDAAYAYTVRDDHYALAIALYEDAAAEEKLAATRRARQAIQGDLERARAEREAALEQTAERLQADADRMRDAADAMEQTQSEKEAFDAEFDEELGDLDDFFE